MKKEKNKRKKILIILLIITIIILALLYFICLPKNKTKGVFYEDLFSYLANSSYDEKAIDKDYLKEISLYDENFICEAIKYEDNVLKFYNCEIKEDDNVTNENFCTYDGKNFECEEEVINDIKFNMSHTNATNQDVQVQIFSDKEIKYCTSSDNKCTPNEKYIDVIEINTEGEHYVCASSENNSTTICSEPIIIDKTKPSINDPIITGTIGNNGWYKSNVSIKLNGATDNLSGVNDIDINISNINYDTEEEVVVITAVDNAGNESTKELTFKVDKTKPDIGNYTVSGIKGDNDWYISDVSISDITATDALSGLVSVKASETSFITETKGTNMTITAIDEAGNIATVTKEIKIDKTAPSVGSLYIDGTAGNDNWYISDILLSGTGGKDNISGIASNSVSKSIIDYDTSGEIITLTTTDSAGHKTTKEFTVKVDKTKPVIGNYTVSGTSGDNGWYISDVSISDITATDTLSGLVSVKPNKTIFTAETKGTNMTITAIDAAGNIATVTEEIRIDKTAPIIGEIVIDGTEGNNGWYISNLLLSGTGGSDSISGIESSKVNVEKIDYDTSGKTVTLTTKDLAGHKVTKDLIIKVDKTKPNIDELIFFGAEGNEGWFQSDITISTPTGSDSLSGLKSINANKTIFTEETNGTELIVTAIDEAGNTNIYTHIIKIDKTAPTITDYLIDGTKGSNGWYTSTVTIKNLVATDNGSGVNTTLLNSFNAVIGYETKGTNVELTASDIAGNKSTLVVPIKVDLTNPTSGEIILTGDEGNDGWYTSEVEVDTTTGTDDISGIMSSKVDMELLLGQKLVTTVVLTTIDNSGRTTTSTKTVKIDKDIPEVGTIKFNGTKGDDDWYVTDVSIDIEEGSDSGSGHAGTTVNLLEITTNTIGTVVTITTIDVAGNPATNSEIVKIDKDKPSLIVKKDNEVISLGTDYPITNLFESPNFSISEGNMSCTIENTKDLTEGSYSSTCTLTGGNGLTDVKTVNFRIEEDLDAIKEELVGIKSTTGSYIKTGFFPSSNTRMIVDFTFLGPKGESVWLFSSRKAYKNQMIGIAWNTTENLLQFNNISYNLGSTAYKQNVRHTIDLSKEAVKLDGVTYADPSDNVWQSTNELYIFANNQSGSAIGHTNGQGIINAAKIYENGVLILDLIPVETIGGEIGLYDKVSEQLLESIGTFTGIY